MSRYFLILIVLICASNGFAVVLNTFSSSGVVKSFDHNNVTVSSQDRIFKISKKSVTSGKLAPGQTVEFKLSGEEVQKFYFTKPASARTPSNE